MDEPTEIPEGSEIELVIADDEDNLDEKNESVRITLRESPGRARREATHALRGHNNREWPVQRFKRLLPTSYPVGLTGP